jgi:predicted MFS family arabinose efflux permease
MVSNLAMGAGFAAFVALLIPPYVTEVTGKASEAGIVMAVISLAAVLGPVLGGFADKFNAHRLVLAGGVFGLALGFAMYGVSAESSALLALDAIIIGVSVAAQQAVAPAFIVGTDLSQKTQAKQLTTLNLTYPIGQVIGGVLLGAAAAAGWSYTQRFWLAAVFMLAAAILTWLTAGGPAKRIRTEAPAAASEGAKKAGGTLRAVFLSTFGVFLLILVLSSITNNGINNQIANILPNLYGFDQATTSGLISLAGLINIAFFLVAGAWMARSGALPGFTFGQILRLVGSLAMALLGLVANAPILLVAASVQILYQGNPFTRLAQSPVAVRFSPVPPTVATGFVLGASALGSFIGSILGGYLADSVGFNAINWMGAIAAALAVLLVFVSLWPAERKMRAAEEGATAIPRPQESPG